MLLIVPLVAGYVSSTGILNNTCGFTSQPDTDALKIAVFDSLSTTHPDGAFVDSLSQVARQHGYSLEYYPPDSSTVDMLANLPYLGYSLVIFRTHGATVDYPVIGTSDPYDGEQRIGDQLGNRIVNLRVQGYQYFAVTPSFVENDMCGQFKATTILAMGCSTMSTNALARAFVERGAKAFVGWTGSVTVSYTDFIFGHLARSLVSGETVTHSVQGIIQAFGPDPATGSSIAYYPA